MNEPSSQRAPTVYVVDDEQQICALLERILAREGYAVRAFSDPQEALHEIECGRPDLVVTDLMMPGLSGLELIARTRTVSPRTAAVVISGYASIGSVVEALRSGVDDFVTKPFSVSEIRAVVSAVLAKRATTVREDERAASVPSPYGAPSGVVPDASTESSHTRTHPPAGPASEPAPPGIGYADAALSRRITEMSVRERLHALLGEDVAAADLAARSADLLRAALNIGHAVILVPAPREGGFRVLGSTAQAAAHPANESRRFGSLELAALAALSDSGAPADLARTSVEPLFPLLDTGPVAAAPLRARSAAVTRRHGTRHGAQHDPRHGGGAVLVVSRPAGEPPLDGDELRRLGVAASALGDVLHARSEIESAETAYVESLGAVAAATEARIPCFARHSQRVRTLAVRLARRVGLAANDVDVLDGAARLLDVGRVSIPDALLEKKTELSESEWSAVRRHVAVADDLVRPVGRLRHAKPIIRHHHENWDGSGYPDGLQGEEIPYLAALVRIADAYAALTAPRSWRSALGDDAALRKIRDLAGRHFHPELVEAFVEIDRSDEAATT